MERSRYCYDCVTDVLEEDALNQKYCVEVLRKLIVKGDTDIEELEEELLLLETQLQWAEQQKFSDIFELCSKALEEKITSLELSICALKTSGNDDDDFSLQSEVFMKPVEKVYEIINALISNSFQDNVEQQGDGTEEADESNAVPSGNVHTVDSSSDPAVAIRDLPERKSSQESVVNTTVADSVGSLLILEEQKLRDLTDLNHVEDVLVLSAMDTIASFGVKPEIQKMADEINLIKSKPQKSETRSVGKPKSSSLLKRKKEKNGCKVDNVEVQKSKVSSPDDTLSLSSYLELQSQRKKDMMHLDDITSQKGGTAPLIISPKPSSISVRKKNSPKPTGRKHKEKIRHHSVTEKRKPSTVGNDFNLQAQVKVKKKRARALIFESIDDKGQAPHPADTGETSLRSVQAVEMESVVIDLDPIDASSEKELLKPKRKRPTTSASIKNKKMVPAASHFDKISLDSIFKAYDPSLFTYSYDVVEENEATMTYNEIHSPSSSEFLGGDMSKALVGPNEYVAWSLLELKSLAKARGLKGYSKMRKDQLIASLIEVKVD